MKNDKSRAGSRRRGFLTSTGVLAAAILAVSVVACGGAKSTGEVPAKTLQSESFVVQVAEAVPTKIARQARVSATIEPSRRVAPGTKLLGRVESVTVSVGDFVKAGTVLARIESRDLEAALDQAQASFARAEAEYENARLQHERMSRLHLRNSVTDKMLEDAVSAFKRAEASRDQARAQVAAAEAMLDYASIETPISGWITAKSIEAGDMVQPGLRAFVVEQTSRVKVIAKVPEREVSGLAPGSPATVEIEAVGWSREIPVSRVVPSGDSQSRTFDVEIDVDNPGFRLKPGMFARVIFSRETVPVLLVPSDAVVRRGQVQGIFVVDEQSVARLRWVRLGRRVGDQVEVLAGLAAEEEFILEPPALLRDGSTVARRGSS